MGDRKVILIKGDHSNWYDEVIFIVKSNANVPQSPAEEAERIIKMYIAEKYRKNNTVGSINSYPYRGKIKSRKKVSRKNAFVNKAIDVCLVLVLIALAFLVYLTFL